MTNRSGNNKHRLGEYIATNIKGNNCFITCIPIRNQNENKTIISKKSFIKLIKKQIKSKCIVLRFHLLHNIVIVLLPFKICTNVNIWCVFTFKILLFNSCKPVRDLFMFVAFTSVCHKCIKRFYWLVKTRLTGYRRILGFPFSIFNTE